MKMFKKIHATDAEIIIRPKVLTKKNVIYWSEHYRRLEGSQKSKARKLLELDCIEWDKPNKVWLCKPIPGYNKTTYHINKVADKFKCSCQFNCKIDKICSHILALYLFLKIKNWEVQKNE